MRTKHNRGMGVCLGNGWKQEQAVARARSLSSLIEGHARLVKKQAQRGKELKKMGSGAQGSGQLWPGGSTQCVGCFGWHFVDVAGIRECDSRENVSRESISEVCFTSLL